MYVWLGVQQPVAEPPCDLWNPNEPTYSQTAVEMAEGGNWLVPHLNGRPFVDKPDDHALHPQHRGW